MAKTLFDAVYGSIIGGTIGDALGAPAIRPEQFERANVPLFHELESDPHADFYSVEQRLIAALLAPSQRSPGEAGLNRKTSDGDLWEGGER